MIEGLSLLLPENAKCFVFEGECDECHLLPEERALVRQAVPKRIREFAGGRYCARQALQLLGISPRPILVGDCREPIWPPGIVGSITHCEGCCAAVVARSRDIASLGLDVEPSRPLPEGVLETIASPWELERLARLPQDTPWDRLLFSAKESFYKAWYPLHRTWLDFLDATLEFRLEDRSFLVQLAKPNSQVSSGDSRWIGRYNIGNNFLFTAVAVEQDDSTAFR